MTIDKSPFRNLPEFMPTVEPDPGKQWPFGQLHYLDGTYKIGANARRLSPTALAVATLAAFGYNNKQISEMPGIDLNEDKVAKQIGFIYRLLPLPAKSDMHERPKSPGRPTLMPRLLGYEVLKLAEEGDFDLMGFTEEDLVFVALAKQGYSFSEIGDRLDGMAEQEVNTKFKDMNKYTGVMTAPALVTSAITVAGTPYEIF